MKNQRKQSILRGIYPGDDPSWRMKVNQLASSSDIKLRRAIYLGHSYDHTLGPQTPMLFSRGFFEGGGLVEGGQGDGKSAVVFAPIISQLAGLQRRELAEPQLSLEYPYSWSFGQLVIDLKGDPFLAETVRLACKRNGIPFVFYSSVGSHPSHVYPILRQAFFKQILPNERTGWLQDSLGLFDQSDSNQKFYSAMARFFLKQLARNQLSSFAELKPFIDSLIYVLDEAYSGQLDNLQPRVLQHATSAIATWDMMADCPHINVTDDVPGLPEDVLPNAIDVDKLLRADAPPVVVYFYLRQTDRSLNSWLASTLLSSLVSAAGLLQDQGVLTRQVYVWLDEGQEIMGSVLRANLSKARQMGVNIVFSTQSLKNFEQDIRDILQESPFQLRLSAKQSDNREELSKRSGETVEWVESHSETASYNNTSIGVTYTPRVVPRHSVNDIIRITDRRGLGILSRTPEDPHSLTRLHGHDVTVEFPFSTTVSEYQRRMHHDWKKFALPGTISAHELRRLMAEPRVGPPKPTTNDDQVDVPPHPDIAQALRDELTGRKRKSRRRRKGNNGKR